MARTSPTKALILHKLTEGPTTLQSLRKLCGISPSGLRSMVSRLRNEGFRIFAESTPVSGDPRYRLDSGPGSMGPSFVCKACRRTIRLGHVEDHHTTCAFGPQALQSLLSKEPLP